MSHAERYAWMSLVAWSGILFFLLVRFTTGVEVLGQSLGATLVEQSPGRLLRTYLGLAVAAIVAESAIAAVLAARRSRGIERDERDVAIEARANLAAYWFTGAALNVVVIHVLAGAAYGLPFLAWFDLTSLTGVAFVLLLVLTLAQVVQRVATLWAYRAR